VTSLYAVLLFPRWLTQYTTDLARRQLTDWGLCCTLAPNGSTTKRSVHCQNIAPTGGQAPPHPTLSLTPYTVADVLTAKLAPRKSDILPTAILCTAICSCCISGT